MGWLVESPAEHDEEMGFDPGKNSLDGFDPQAAMRWDLACVLEADMVVVLPGWERSEGTGIEIMVAHAIGTDVWEYPTGEYPLPRLPTWQKVVPPDVNQEAPYTTILHEASAIVNGPRRESYGHPKENFGRVAQLWSGIVGSELTAEDVGLMMILFKVSREFTSHDRDNLVDIAGYARTQEMLYDV
jgi:hypothetical protein